MKSLRKLLAADCPYRLWVYYGNGKIRDVLEDLDTERKITVIDFPMQFKKKKRKTKKKNAVRKSWRAVDPIQRSAPYSCDDYAKAWWTSKNSIWTTQSLKHSDDHERIQPRYDRHAKGIFRSIRTSLPGSQEKTNASKMWAFSIFYRFLFICAYSR